MSSWGSIEAQFAIGKSRDDRESFAQDLRDEIEDRDARAPTGSESGPTVFASGESDFVSVDGRLRDVDDVTDSPMVLAWFVRVVNDPVHPTHYATLTWEIDGGPRYRYVWENHKLTKLKGVLDA